MNQPSRMSRGAFALAFCSLAFAAAADDAPPRKLAVCCTVPSLGSIVQSVGGDLVEVTTFAKGSENPHFLDARPSHVKALAAADLFVQQGLELELGWAPVLLQQCRNAKVQLGQPGFLDASQAITPLGVPTTPVDRSHGDVHPFGNPHYLTDPLNGLAVARLVRDRLAQLEPAAAADLAQRCAAFERRLCVALVGEKLATDFPAETVVKLARLAEEGGLLPFLEQQGRAADLGGWLGVMAPFHGTVVVADHDQWAYFGRRFGLRFAGFLEPKPGIAPSTAHLAALIGAAPAAGVKAVLTAPGFDPKSARFVADKVGVPLLVLAHEVGATAEAGDYVAMIDHDVRTIVATLSRRDG